MATPRMGTRNGKWGRLCGRNAMQAMVGQRVTVLHSNFFRSIEMTTVRQHSQPFSTRKQYERPLDKKVVLQRCRTRKQTSGITQYALTICKDKGGRKGQQDRIG